MENIFFGVFIHSAANIFARFSNIFARVTNIFARVTNTFARLYEKCWLSKQKCWLCGPKTWLTKNLKKHIKMKTLIFQKSYIVLRYLKNTKKKYSSVPFS